MSAMPPPCVHDAVLTLWKTYQFGLEDAELGPVPESYLLARGVGISDTPDDW